jgi:hypothetical protein
MSKPGQRDLPGVRSAYLARLSKKREQAGNQPGPKGEETPTRGADRLESAPAPASAPGDLLSEVDRARLRRSAPPPPVMEIEWGAGLDALVITVRQGRADPPYWESHIEWAVPSFEDGEQVGSRMRGEVLPGYATTITEAACRALAGLFSLDRWTPDLSDYVLEKALQAARDQP